MIFNSVLSNVCIYAVKTVFKLEDINLKQNVNRSPSELRHDIFTKMFIYGNY